MAITSGFQPDDRGSIPLTRSIHKEHMKNFIIRSVLILSLLLCGTVHAESSVPENQGYVTDLSGTLSTSESDAISQALETYERETTNEIYVLLVPTTNGVEISDRSLEIFRTWGIGQKEKNNGVLMLIAVEDRKIWITTGYGLEGVLPDLLVKSIIDSDITPRFKQGKYAEGIQDGISSLKQGIAGEYTPDVYTPIQMPIWIFFAALAVFISFFIYGFWSIGSSIKAQRKRMTEAGFKQVNNKHKEVEIKKECERIRSAKRIQRLHCCLYGRHSLNVFEA